MFEFFAARLSPSDPGPLNTLLHFFAESAGDSAVPFNYTRSGYIAKVLNSLLLNRFGTVALHLLGRPADLHVLLQSCHCKSAAATVLTLLTLVALTGQTPMMLVAPQGFGDKQNEVLASQVAADVVSATAESRGRLFASLLDLCVATADDKARVDLHSNLAWVVGQVLAKNLSERPMFLQVFMAGLPRVVGVFVAEFDSPQPNKLGFLFLVAVEVLSKEGPADKEGFLFEGLPGFVGAFVGALERHAQRRLQGQTGHLTQSYSREGARLNPKVYKVLETLNVVLKLYADNAEFVRAVVEPWALERVLFGLLTAFPFNNVLHNQVKKLLLIVIERGGGQLVRRFFVDNPGFDTFVDHVNAKGHLIAANAKWVKAGYVGQVVAVVKALKAHSPQAVAVLSESELSRGQLEGIRGGLLRGGAGTGEQGAGRHRLPRRRPGQLPELLRLLHRGGQESLLRLPQPQH